MGRYPLCGLTKRDSDGANTSVCADDCTNVTNDDFTGVHGLHHLKECIDVCALCVKNSNSFKFAVVLLQHVDQECKRLRASALLACFFNESATNFNEWLDGECASKQCLGATNSAALLQVLQCVESAENMRAGDE